MKALLINSLTSGGAERIVLNIYRQLKIHRTDILLICLVKENIYNLEKDDRIIYLSNKDSFRRGISFSKFLLFPVILFKLRKIVITHKIDTIQSHLYSSSILNVFLKFIGSKHQVQIVNHSSLNYEKKFKLSGLIKFFVLKKIYNSAHKIISISEKMKIDINKSILKRNIEHQVIPNPHDIDLIIEKSHEASDFLFQKDSFYIITSGRLIKSKKVDNLIRAFHQVQSSIDSIQLIILGDGEEKYNLQELTRSLKLENNVHFLGHVSNPFNYINKSNLFVLASESEGLPNVIIESIICKTYVISCDCQTGPREILAPESDLNYQISEGIEIANHGILIPVNKIKEITDSINYFLDHKDILEQNLESSFLYAQRYSIQNTIKKYDQIMI